MRGDEAYGCAESRDSEVRDDSEPGEVRWLRRVEAGLVELLGERFGFKINRRAGEVLWNRNSAGLEELALPLLGGRVVDFEDMEVRPGIAIGEGVESGSEEDVLADSVGDGAGEVIFGVAAAGYEVRPHRDGEWPIHASGGAANLLCVGFSEKRNSDWVGEDHRLVVKLVGRAAESDAESGPGWDGLLHSLMVAEGR